MMDATAVAADWAELLEQATREVFLMMLGCEMEVQSGQPQSGPPTDLSSEEASRQPAVEVLFQRGDTPGASPEVTAMVGVAGELCGVLNFVCGLAGARMMAARMLGVDESAAGDQQWDAIGEICNMIAGNFKAKLPELGARCMLSVPTIVFGSNYRLRALAAKRKIDLAFTVEGAPIRLSLELQQ